jgi:hypothetical protein
MQRFAASSLLILMLSGCAFTDIPLTLPTKGLESTIPGGRGRQVVRVRLFPLRRSGRALGSRILVRSRPLRS